MSYGNAFGPAANRLGSPEASLLADSRREYELDYDERCVWPKCPEERYGSLPLCMEHAWKTARIMEDWYPAPSSPLHGPESSPAECPTLGPYVYYLMLSPVTVKIGTTISLVRRIRELRSEMQYVVAVELGGTDLERQRHRQFTAERRNIRREDFHLSDALKRHIDSLHEGTQKILSAIA